MKNQFHIPLITSLLTVLIGIGLFAQMSIGDVSALVTPGGEMTITNPTSNSVWAVGHWYDITAENLSAGAITGGGNYRLVFSLNDNIPGNGMTHMNIGSTEITNPLRDPADPTKLAGSYTFSWQAGYYEGMTLPIPPDNAPFGPWIGQSQITARLFIVMADGSTTPIGNETGVTTPTFTINRTVINITNPSASLSPHRIWNWGLSTKLEFTTVGGIRGNQVRVQLLNGATPVFVAPIVTCTLATQTILSTPVAQTCIFDMPNKPAGVIDGDTFSIKVYEFNLDPSIDTNQIDTDYLASDSRLVNMQSKMVSGTYISQPFPIVGGVRIASIQSATAIYNDNISATSNLNIGIGFFGGATGATNLCLIANVVNLACTGFATDGFYNIQSPSGEELPLASILNSTIPAVHDATFIKIRIYMSSSEFHVVNPNIPWVQTVGIIYTADTLGGVGDITANDITVNKSNSVGVPYTFVINRSDTSFTGTVDWLISVPVPGPVGVTITPSSGTASFGTGGCLAVGASSCTITTLITTSATATTATYNVSATPQAPNDGSVISPDTFTVNVADTAAFTLGITPATQSVARGENAIYSVAVVGTGYDNPITLTDNVIAQFGGTTGDVVSVTYTPSNIIHANSVAPITLIIATKATSTNVTPRTFNVTGTSQTAVNASASLAIVDPSTLKTINLAITAPVEGASVTTQPVFTFRLYNSANAKIFEKADLLLTADTVTIENIAGLSVNGVYRGFARTTRHLWKQANNTITITSAITQPLYTMTFPKLLAGELSGDNSINSVDYPIFVRDYGKSQAGLIPDFNGDGAVNSGDWNYILANWFKIGSPLPGTGS